MAEIKGMTIKVGLDATEVTQGVKDTDKALKSEEEELKRVNQNMKFDTSKVDSWHKKTVALQNVIKELNNKIAEQKLKVEAAAKAAETGGAKAEKKYLSEQNQLEKLNKKLTDYNLQLTNAAENEKKAKGAELAQNLGKVAAVATIAVAAIKKVADALINMAESATSAIVSINESAVNAGLAVEEYQKLAYAASQVFVSSSSIETAMTKVNGILGDFASGEGLDAAETLAKIGLNYQDIASMDTEEAFYAIIDALGQMDNETEALAAANDLFGDKLGTKLLPLIEAGSDQLKEYADQAVVVTEAESDLANQSDSLMSNIDNEMTKINAQILPLAVKVLGEVSDLLQNEIMPLVTEFFDYFEDGVGSGAFDGFEDSMVSIGKLLKEVIVDVGKIIADLMPALNSIFKLLSPILDLITGILDALMPLVDSILQPISDLIADILGPLGELLQVTVPILTDSLKEIATWIADILDLFSPLMSVGGTLIKFFMNAITEILKPLKELYEKFVIGTSEMNHVLQPFADTINGIFSKVKEFFDWIIDKINKFGSWILNLLGIDTSGIGSQIEESAAKVSSGTNDSVANGEVTNNNNSNTYNVTINTTSSTVSIEDLDRALAAA